MLMHDGEGAHPASSEAGPVTVVELLRRRFAANPDRCAFLFLENGETESQRLTAKALDRRARAVAAALQEEGAAGERVLLLYPSGAEFVVAYLACLYAGVTPVPSAPPAGRRYSERLAAIAADADARWALTDDRELSRLGKDDWPAELRRLRWRSVAQIGEHGADLWRLPEIGPDTLALLQYTSGSTAAPRGVMVTHRHLLDNFRDFNIGWSHSPNSVFVNWLPVFHDLGLIYGLLQPLTEGCLCVMMPPAAFLQSPVRWLQAISRHHGTHAAAPNFAYDLCVSRVTAEQRRDIDLSSWQVALNAAEPIRADTIERFCTAFASFGFARRAMTPGYGLAEATLKVTTNPAAASATVIAVDAATLACGEIAEAGAENCASQTMRLVGSGVPVAETLLRIVEPKSCTVAPPNRVGEVWISGRIVAQGYWRRSEDTEATFRARLAGEPESAWLRTGDLGFLRNGELFITGRLNDVIIIRGLNHYPQDIEHTVEGCHPVLRATGCAAFGVAAEDEERLVIAAEVDRSQLRSLDPEAVFAAIREAIAEAHRILPVAIFLLKPNSVPKTSSGKLRRGACRRDFLANRFAPIAVWERPASGEPAPDQAAGYNQPLIRAWLIRHFAMRLGVSANTIDPAAPLSNYGINSAEAAALAAVLQNWLGLPIAETLAFDYPTIEAIARHLGQVAPAAVRKGGERRPSAAIAVVGLGCRFPGAANPEEFWQLLYQSRDAVGAISASRRQIAAQFAGDGSAGEGPVGRGGFLADIDLFDSEFFGISPREAEYTDPQQRLLLEVGWEALEDAGIAPDSLSGSRTGVFVGISNSDYTRLMMQGEVAGIYLGTGSALSIAANRLSYLLDLRGPSLAIDTACSSSLVAVATAVESLRRGECDLALAGGVNLVLSPEYTIAFATAQMLAPDGRCKAFDASADGYVRGEGAGLAVLKRLEEAERDGDRILAVVRGVAVNQDGRTAGLTAPNGPAQQAVIGEALRDAGIPPARIGYIEAHGTGTPLGDPIEVNALATILLRDRPTDRPCYIGSVKTNIGHLESAAGIAGFTKTVLTLAHRTIPASLHCRVPNPRLQIDGTPVRIAMRQEALDQNTDGPRVAGVSSFGFGGTNAHVVVEEYDPPPRAPLTAAERQLHVLSLSARDRESLAELAERYCRRLTDLPEGTFPDACFTAATGRNGMVERLAFVAASAGEARAALADWLAGNNAAGRLRIATGRCERGQSAHVVFLFTGHGAQYPGMGRELYHSEPVFRAAIDRCDEILRPALGEPLGSLLYGKAPAGLQDMRITQPALVAVEYALSQLWASWGIKPAAVIGHSLGEYAAACIAGALSLEDALQLVAARGGLFESLPRTGVMVAALAGRETVEEAFGRWAPLLSIAAVNGPKSVVFSGSREAAMAVSRGLTARGIKCTELAVAQSAHSPLVDGMLDAFVKVAAGATALAPCLPLVSNLTGTWLTAPPNAAYWRAHMREPVLFQAGLETLLAAGYDTFLEIGPHGTLSAIGEQSDARPGRSWLASLMRNEPPHLTMLASLGALWCRGFAIDWTGFDRGRGRRRVSLPTSPFRRRRCWIAPAPRRRKTEAAASHPLLGLRLYLATGGNDIVFEGRLPGEAGAYIGDHRIFGVPVLPFAAYLELAIAGAATTHDAADAWQLDEVKLLRPMSLPNLAERVVQTVMRPAEGGIWSWSVFSRDADSPGEWLLHATGRIAPADGVAPADGTREPSDPDEITAKPGEIVDPDGLFRDLARDEIALGPAYRKLSRLRLREGEAICILTNPGEESAKPRLYRFAPALLDAALPTAAFALRDRAAPGPLLPSGIRRVRIVPRSRPVWSCIASQTVDPVSTAADLRCFDEHGALIAEIERISFVPANRAAFRGEWPDLYGIEWVEADCERRLRPAERRTAWLIFADRGGTGAALTKVLAARGESVVMAIRGAHYEQVESNQFSIRRDRCEDYDRLLGDLPTLPDVIVHLWSLDAGASESIDNFREATADGSVSAVLLLQVLLRRVPAGVGRVWLVTRRAQSAQLPPSDAGVLQAPLWGIGKTIALEHADRWGGLIDLGNDSPLVAARRLLDQIDSGDGEDHIAFRGGRRLVARIVRRTAQPRRTALEPEATYLITGGLGALGQAVAARIVAAGARHLVLASRSGASTEERRAALRRLEATGAKVQALAIDVCSPAQVEELLARIDRPGSPLRGIIHAAGESAYLSLRDMTPEAVVAAYAAKAEGALVLYRATQDKPLRFFACVSSMVGSWGAANQAHYAAANHFLDQLAHHGATRGVVSVALGPLSGGMLPPAIAAAMERLGVTTASLDDAATAILCLLGEAGSHFIAADMDWTLYRAVLEPLVPRPLFAQLEPAATVPADSRAGALSDRLRNAAAAERLRILKAEIISEAARVLGMNPRAWPGPTRGFFDLGMNSLTALELRRGLEAALGRTVPATLVFDHPNVEALASAIARWFENGEDFVDQSLDVTEEPPEPTYEIGDLEAALHAKLDRLEALVGHDRP